MNSENQNKTTTGGIVDNLLEAAWFPFTLMVAIVTSLLVVMLVSKTEPVTYVHRVRWRQSAGTGGHVQIFRSNVRDCRQNQLSITGVTQ